MARNLKKEMFACADDLFASMREVHKKTGVPVSAELGASLFVGAAYMGMIENRINKTRDLSERRMMISEFDRAKKVLCTAAQKIREHASNGKEASHDQEECLPGVRRSTGS